MAQEEVIRLFDSAQIRVVWDSDTEKYYFSVVDVIQVLTDSADEQAIQDYRRLGYSENCILPTRKTNCLSPNPRINY